MTDDPELQEIFTDPAHQEVLDLLKASKPGTPPLDPHFRSYLRAKLMTEARRTLPAEAVRPWWRLRPRALAMSTAAVAAGFLVVLGAQVYLHGGSSPAGTTVAVVSPIDNRTDVATTAEPIQLQFSGPVDKNAVADSVVIEPATSVTKQWVGSTLVIIPNHPLAPNTTYTVRLQPKATTTPAASAAAPVKASPTPRPTPVVVHFTTVRAPLPQVVPPSFKSSNVTYGHDNRIANAGSIVDAVWTSGGQLVATRPAGQSGSAATSLPSPSGSASPGSANATDVWLLSPAGTPLRELAAGASMPSTPATGSMFAAWTVTGGQARLEVRDLQGNLIATVATINGIPDRAAVWIGTDRLAFSDKGLLKMVDIHGSAIALPEIHFSSGSLAASASGTLLAVEATDGSSVLDLTQSPATATPLQAGATGYRWSAKGDLAFVVQQSAGTDLYVAADGKNAVKVGSSPAGVTWSNLNWAPDATSLLLATKANDSNAGPLGLLLINRDGTTPRAFGASQREYASPQWSPSGDLVLFTRHDDATGGITFQVATASTSGTNPAEQQALTEVDTFMKARLKGDSAAAQAELDSNGQAAYQAANATLVSPTGTHFDRYYPVTVQSTGTNPNRFLIGVRTFLANTAGTETRYFEEQLVVLQSGQRYLIHDVQASPSQALGHGPTVVSVEVQQAPPGQVVNVRFDADLKPESVTSGTIEIKDASGNLVDAHVSFDANNHLVTLATKLRPGTYQLVVTTGVTDIEGTPLAAEYDAPLVISR
jgi:hypothetical protein